MRIFKEEDMDLLVREQVEVEQRSLPALFEACVRKYIEDYDWVIIFNSLPAALGTGSYTYTVEKRRRRREKKKEEGND